MKKVNVYNIKGEKVKEVELNPDIFDLEVSKGLVQQVTEAQLANARHILAHTKNRGEVRGGGKKPWKQKGTGRARHGSTRSPLWVGGGVTFGPRSDRNFSKKINKTMKKQALFMVLSDKVRNDKLVLLDELNLVKPNTKNILTILKQLPTYEAKTKKVKIKSKDQEPTIKEKKVKELAKTLIVAPSKVTNLYLSVRNLPKTEVIRADSLNIVDILKYKYIVAPMDSIAVIEKNFLKK